MKRFSKRLLTMLMVVAMVFSLSGITTFAAEPETVSNEEDGITSLAEGDSYDVKYAVALYGIEQDVDEDGNILGLTFGPATGASYRDAYKAHLTEEEYNAGEDGVCLHWMSWDEIIEQSKEDPEVFEECLENGCTHSVELDLNDALYDTSYGQYTQEGDGTGMLFSSLKSSYREWNATNSNEGGWPASRIRATLNGADEYTDESVAGDDVLSAQDSLISCFPEELQGAITAKAVMSDIVYSDQTAANNVTTYDKLWLFSGKELYGDSGSNNDVIRYNEGDLYQRSTELGITTSNNGNLKNYYEYGNSTSNESWLLRSQYTGSAASVCYITATGGWRDATANSTGYGVAPGFCLAGPAEEPEPEAGTVRYAVSIWGINHDVDADGNTLGLTFGPATGETNCVYTYKAHLKENEYDPNNGKFCIHWMDWDEIIEQSKIDPTVFRDCLDEGCTHAVELTLNSTICNKNFTTLPSYAGDGGGQLFSCIDSDYLKWNSSATTEGGWPASQIRAVLNGKDELTGNNASNALDAEDSLFSCFPSELQEGIVAKAVKSDTVYDDVTDEDPENNVTTCDKLWLFSGIELWGPGGYSDSALRENEGSLYERSIKLGITTGNYEGLKTFDETGDSLTSVRGWWTRTQYRYNNNYPIVVGYLGDWNADTAVSSTNGLSPGFCLAGPEVMLSSVTITSDATDNTKTYDGTGITLTATTDPEGADVNYRWFGPDGAAIEGATSSEYTTGSDVADSGSYKCIVTDDKDGSTAEDTIVIMITRASGQLSYADTSVEKTTDEKPFTNELTIATLYSEETGASIKYESSNPEVATVDAATGEVTIVGAGEATITATAAATDNYKEAAASYTLTVILTKSLNGSVRWVDGGREHDNASEVTLSVTRIPSSASPASVRPFAAEPETMEDIVVVWKGDDYAIYASYKQDDDTYIGFPVYDDDGFAYTYIVTEAEIPGYQIIDDENGNFTNIITCKIEGTKIWDDKDNQDGKRPDSVDILLIADGEVAAATTATEADSWAWTFGDVPVYEDGVAIRYFVVEDDVEGYTAAYEYSVEDDGAIHVDITNTHAPDETAVTVEKVWDDKDDQDGKRPADVTIELVCDEEVVDTMTLNEGNNWTGTFENLPKYHKGGTEYIYSVNEISVEEYDTEMIKITDNAYVFVNEYTPEETEVTVCKEWNDDDDRDGIRPGAVTVNLMADGELYESATLNDSDQWACTFGGLPVCSRGEEIEYTVVEAAVEGYEPEITGDAETGFTVTNTHEPETTDVTVTKIWEDNDDMYGFRPAEITVRLLADDEPLEGATLTLSEGEDWTGTFEDLYKYNKDGIEIAYFVEETARISGYEFASVTSMIDENGEIAVEIVNELNISFFPLDEEIVPGSDDEESPDSWVKQESVNEYDAIEIEMSTTLPSVDGEILAAGDFSMTFHNELATRLVLDELDSDFTVDINGQPIDHQYYEIEIADSTVRTRLLRIFSITDDCAFHVNVDLSALYNDGVIDEDDLGTGTVRVFFYADLETTDVNGSYTSTAWYDVLAGDEVLYTSETSTVAVYTFEIIVDKYDTETNEALADATFGIFYDEACENAVSRNGEDYIVTTDENGQAIFVGIAEGTYYVKELSAPEGYELNEEVLTFTVEGSEDGGHIVELPFGNTPIGDDQETGDEQQGGDDQQDEGVTKDDLSDEIEAVEALNEGDYTPESWNDLQDALANAITVFNDPDATEEEILAAIAQLQDAVNNLKAVDTTGGTGSGSGSESSGSSTASAKTADNNTPYLYLLLVLMAGAAIVTVSMRRRTVRK